MSGLNELYQEVILDHYKNPRNYGKLEGANKTAEGYNPLCGDQVTLYVQLKGDVIQDIRFEGSGCAISKACASMMTGALKGKTVAEAEALFKGFHHLVTGKEDDAEGGAAGLGKLAVFSGVREFPVRVKCATLAWHTLRAALEEKGETISTEKD